MINFPVFQHLKIENYGMFPGTKKVPGINMTFKKGPSLILGINGLGKTTLITILLRLLTGPYDLTTRGGSGKLGHRRLSPVKIQDFRSLANRVADGAKEAVAELSFSIGGQKVKISRNLSDLSSQSFKINSQEYPIGDKEKEFQKTLSNLMGVSTFSDVLLILHHLIFYTEERRDLVWDKSAQTPILFSLFLQKFAKQRLQLTEEIISHDSQFRTLRTIVNRNAANLFDRKRKFANLTETKQNLEDMRINFSKLKEKREMLNNELEENEKDTANARLNIMRARDQRDESLREYESFKFKALETYFPKAEDTNRYILTHFLSEKECLACGSRNGPELKKLEKRQKGDQCIICGSPLIKQKKIVPISQAIKKRSNHLYLEIQKLDLAISFENDNLDSFRAKRKKVIRSLEKINSQVENLGKNIRQAERELPSDEREITNEERSLNALREEMEQYLLAREKAEEKFEKLIQEGSKEIQERHQSITEKFTLYASGFLLENCKLTYEPQRERIGQGGSYFDFPAFSLEMTGGATPGLTLRRGPTEVSSSQREFIDLAYRMALMNEASNGGPSTIIIDTPESSLDIVFSERAGKLLYNYSMEGTPVGNRLVVTSNLGNSDFIPALLKKIPATKRKERMIDLLEVAAENAALREHAPIFKKARDRLLK